MAFRAVYPHDYSTDSTRNSNKQNILSNDHRNNIDLESMFEHGETLFLVKLSVVSYSVRFLINDCVVMFNMLFTFSDGE